MDVLKHGLALPGVVALPGRDLADASFRIPPDPGHYQALFRPDSTKACSPRRGIPAGMARVDRLPPPAGTGEALWQVFACSPRAGKPRIFPKLERIEAPANGTSSKIEPADCGVSSPGASRARPWRSCEHSATGPADEGHGVRPAPEPRRRAPRRMQSSTALHDPPRARPPTLRGR